MMPLGDDNSLRKTAPVVTYILIVINILVFLLEVSAGEAFIEKWAFVPSRFSQNPSGELSTIFTSMFMHGGWLHLFGNMLYLWIFGDNVEDAFGSLKFLAFYLICGVGAVFSQMMIDPGSTLPNVGASGAIAGVLGAYILLFPRGSVRVLVGNTITALPALIVIGVWFLLQFMSQVNSLSSTQDGAGGVAYMAHIGGFIAGVVLTLVFRMAGPPRVN